MVDLGYSVKGDKVKFIYKGLAEKDVRVVGNFMGWSENDPIWKMEYNSDNYNWELEMPISQIKSGITGDFYEFTFLVDGEWIDADKTASNLNFCPGYGYRYLLKI